MRTAVTVYCPVATQSPAEPRNPRTETLSETKNCVPVDGRLKYERLAAAEEKPEPKSSQAKAEKISKDKPAKSGDVRSKPRPYDPVKDAAEYKDLLHREKCFVSGQQ